jgi:polysaccharide chain length determinant protein (PEP-CTERM system associated)
MDVNEGIQIEDLRGIFRRRQSVILWTAGLVFGASIFLAAVLPNEYVADAILMVEPQTISEDLVGTGQGATDLTHRLNLMAAEILSRSRLSRIIDDLELYVEESKEMTREEVIELMREDLLVLPVIPELEIKDAKVEEIDTFELVYRSDDPRTAADVINRLASEFRDEHIKTRTETSGQTSEFLAGELARLATRIQEVEERIASVKTENNGSLPEDLLYNQQLVQRTYDLMREAEREVAAAESDAAFYRQQGLAAPLLADQRFTSPEQKLQLLELRIAEYRSLGFTDKHPDIIATEREIAEVRSSLLGQGDQDSDADEGPPRSLAQQNAEGEEKRAVLRAQASRAEIVRLGEQLAEVQARLAATPRVAERLNGLQREYEHLYASYQDFSAKRLDASVSANIERQVKGERFRVLESAVADPVPASPNRPLIIVLGLLLGLTLSLGLAVMLEAVDTSFHAPSRLQATLQLPVLAAIPQILLEQDRTRQRRHRVRTAALASVVGILVLSSSGVGYVVVNGVPGPLRALTEAESEEISEEITEEPVDESGG